MFQKRSIDLNTNIINCFRRSLAQTKQDQQKKKEEEEKNQFKVAISINLFEKEASYFLFGSV